jgi:transcriptional regulator with XRE-family HTH domain
MGLSEREKTRFYRALGLRLRSLRNQSGYTLEETEEHGVTSWKHLQRIESGEANVTIETLLVLSKIYKVHPSDLLAGL